MKSGLKLSILVGAAPARGRYSLFSWPPVTVASSGTSISISHYLMYVGPRHVALILMACQSSANYVGSGCE
jgi:hypothetical protein